jgi:hypothetical protein
MQVKYDPDFAVRRKLLRLLRDGLAGAEQLHDIVEIVRRAARAIFSADGVALVLNEDGYCHYVDENAIAPLWKGQKFPTEHCISGWTMIHG